jgi:hypothetical protein
MGALASAGEDSHHFHYDHVIGTSMDIVVWTHDLAKAERAREAILDESLRLNSILNTREPHSEISMLQAMTSSPKPCSSRSIGYGYLRKEGRENGQCSILNDHPNAKC